MRFVPLLAALCVLASACRDSVTEPPRTVSDAVPSGLPVASSRGSWHYEANLLDASVAVAGDSVVLTYVSGGGCGHTFEASAGMADGVLVVTDVGRMPEHIGGCAAMSVSGGRPVRLAMRPTARGRVAVVLRERTQHFAPSRDFSERHLLRRTITLP